MREECKLEDQFGGYYRRKARTRGDCGEAEKWPEWAHRLKVDVPEFADGSYVRCGKERG